MPIFRDLTIEILLEKCLHGHTQNDNEAINSYTAARIQQFIDNSTLRFTCSQRKISSTIKTSQNIMNMFVDKGIKHNKTQILFLINQINQDENKGLKKLFHNIEVYFKRSTSEWTK